MVAPNEPVEPEGIDDFPLIETFRDCCGRDRKFQISVHVTDGGYFLRAAEIRKAGEGYHFAAHHPTSPYVALGVLRRRVAEALATRYLLEHKDGRRLGHDRAVGHIGYGCVVIDGQEVPFDEFVEMLQSYEGWRFELRIDDGFQLF